MAFPSNPSIGDTHTEEDTLWTYGSNGWYSTVIGDNNDTKYTCGPALGSLNDVDLDPAPSDGDALVYDLASDSWIPGAGGGGSATPAGSAGEIQFNDGGSPAQLDASSDLVWDDTGKVLEIGGDINLDDGGTYETTLQVVTPTANRTISFPDATGTVALVAGSSGQLLYNNAGANAGTSTITYDGTNVTLSGRFISSLNGAASAPPGTFTGTWFTGGTSTTTKPQVLIEPTGATSTAWSTSGTGFGINAASGFAGNLLDLQVNGSSRFAVDSANSIAFVEYIRKSRAEPTGTIFPSSAAIGTFGLGLQGGGAFGIASGGNASAPDTLLARDAAGIFAQRNAANAQTFRVYNTFTSATNFERAKLQWDTNVLKVGTEKGVDGGTARAMELQTDGTTRINIAANGDLGFFGVTPVAQQTELTDELTTITHTAPGTADFAIQNLVAATGYGFVTEDEGNTVLSVIANLQARVNELETKLVALGFLADAD
jgi:hypothetical protein